MQAAPELRVSWRARWLASIREVADLREQRATWLNSDSDNPHYSFIECMCCYFDDLVLDDEGGYENRIAEGLVNDAEVAAVAALHVILSAYSSPGGNDYDHAAILSDPAWHVVAEEAQRTIDRLRGLLSEPEELRMLSEPSAEALRVSRSGGAA